MNENQEATGLYELIRNFIRRRVRTRELADDLTQETFLRLTSQIPPIVPERVRAWLYRTARNLVTDFFRHAERTKTVTDDLEYMRQKRANSEVLQSSLEQNEEHQMILDLMKELDSAHQEVLRLKFQEELSYQEIAEILDKPKTTIAWLLHDSIMQLRDKVKVAQ